MVRGVGLWAVASGLVQVAWGLVFGVADRFDQSGFGAGMSIWLRAGGGGGAYLLVGFYLLLGGRWIIDRFTREVVGRCRRCGYDLTVHADARCPECGAPSPAGACAAAAPGESH